MSRKIENLEVGLDEDLAQKLAWMYPGHGPYRVLRQSVDARRRHSAHFVYSLEIAESGETLQEDEIKIEKLTHANGEVPIIIGSGPAGLFAALRLVERGIPCLLFERGSESTERIKGINKFWRYGVLDPRNNVCYGEGGAGLYSDGKLITRIKSPHIPYVLHRLVRFGAPEEIKYLANPHVGSDRIRRVIPRLREYLLNNGCKIYFNTQIMEILTKRDGSRNFITGVKTEQGQAFQTSQIILATGHSAEDMLTHLDEIGVKLEGKSFAMGLRVEHPQKSINQIQYRDWANHPKLGSANYKLTHHDAKSGIGVYSFCMCPGGFVLSSGTSTDGLVCNGMSNFNRNSPWANAALVVSIDHEKNFPGDLWGGMKLRRKLENDAFLAVQENGGTKQLPAQNLMNFFEEKNGSLQKGSSPSGVTAVRLDQILPVELKQKLKEGIEKFNISMKGFLNPEAQLYGVESRTSCPIRVVRDEDTLESVSHEGLYPAGEGAGYAGGITSAACDGVKIADRIFEKISKVVKTV
ncbi:MAG: FAD-dependent protein [Bdellovibrionota bacterium]